ncbi:Autophagy-related protein 13 [Colletotrichum sidae]|uniref:Autophagy-related protein 13 n=1 Tax=Colletotrichum sidae TaxID=1347389 RepID=A0A4R8T3I0_9PEZI|nr:Autophagy-related protein 13 [Colletotrichum sidae]
MHQQARPAPRRSSPASSPQTNPSRTNNPREAILDARARGGSEASGRDVSLAGSPTIETPQGLGPPPDSFKKLDQIIQNFHTKAAAVVLHSRMRLKPTSIARGPSGRKPNKWFQIETDEFDDFRDELRVWRNCGAYDRPPPLIIETYLDTSRLTPSQSLVIVDEHGKRWDVLEALNASDSSDDGRSAPAKRNTEVVLERWRIELKATSADDLGDFGRNLANVYKKATIFFRSLFVTTRILPAWKFSQQALTKGAHPSLEPRCRIRAGDPDIGGIDRLRHPLYDGRPDVVTDYVFGDLEVPVGRFYASVAYRNECNFRVDDSESLLSSRFMGVDEDFFRPSLPQKRESRRNDAEVGSLPSHRRSRNLADMHQTYGSLSTFHGDGPLGTSPISALRAVRPPGSDTSSPPESTPTNAEPIPPSSLPVSGLTSRPSVKGFSSTGRRPSVSFQPFKAGSLSGSPVPRTLDAESPASPVSRAAALNALNQPRNRTSLTAGMPASLRGGPQFAEAAVVGSPRPSSTSRYSSSFTHRKGRLSFGGASKAVDDEQGSSGRQSLSSSVAQPGSGLLAETGGGGSSGSLQTDDDQISDFLKALDSKKTLKSFESGKRGEATNRTVAQLSRFHQMRESNQALTDSMTSSMQMHPSSSSSSRQLSNVPSMAAPASVSVSSSPGKPLSPHTPHTPAVPSRLSENSIINYNTSQPRSERGNTSMPSTLLNREDTITQDGTTAIDIPISPRIGTHPRRSSSVAQQNRALTDGDDGDLAFAANRSISLGAEDREPPTLTKATDENLTSEDWGAIIEVCDRVGSDQNGPKEVVQAMIKRMAHRNANVQLYTLELANALSQNCGKNMHRELSSRAFTDALLKLANDRNTHTQVKAKILERMKDWSDMFSKDADLGIMYDAYFRLKQSNPTLQAPSAPQKTGLTDLDRQKEEDELQMALTLSLQDEERKKKASEPTAAPSSSAAPGPSAQAAAQPQTHPTPVPAGTTAATVSRVRALYDFAPSEPGELEFKKGDVIAVLESVYKDWWRGSLKGKTGIFPLNYVEKLSDPTPDELAREAQMEAEVFAEIKNVEKLLTLLSTSNTAPREEDNEEISKLYHQTLAIRPKLIKLIEKYSQKKDDFTQLNEKFIKARRDYESLLESSMSHPPQPSYHQYAMRPGPGSYPTGPAAGYPPQGPPQPQQQQQEHRYYTPAPQEQPQYSQSTPSPGFQRPAQATPAPFYSAGAEVPSAGAAPPAPSQHYPQREPNQRLPSTGKGPAPINTSSPPPVNPYSAYSQPPDQRPQSTYGAQELATSVYDSPIAAHNPSSAATYTSSVYSQEDPYNNPTSPVVGTSTVTAPPPSSYQSSAPAGQPSQPPQPQQPKYQSYQPPSAPAQDNYNNAPTQAPPPVPTGAAPPIPGAGRTGALTPPPLQPGGPAYDARQGVSGQGAQPQYRAYVPPGAAADGPSAPSANDYYRQSGVY